MFGKILIANRGEIALRIMRTCRRMGIKSVAVYSEPDLRAPYVQEADEKVFIGGPAARDSYLDGEKIVCAALERSCEAVHPGYGFLSENAHFARRVADAGLVFIGPTAEAIATLGDKVASKKLAIRAGVPVVPGHEVPAYDPGSLKGIAEKIGYPVLIKPAAGGGGRGLRIVNKPEELASALEESREETRKGFGDDRVFLERYMAKARHIELQVLADSHGNIIHLGERECSIQRRYQKVIEETPSTAVDEPGRREMGRVACALAREAGYVNAGTVEFILDRDGKFYFLEMNTRLQVEHPVTEMVTGLDLVELQIRIAAGERLPLTQDQVSFNGWAIEARVCSEDPSRGFLPTTGIITRYSFPRGRHIRVDSGIQAGSVVTIFYDSLLSKVAAWGPTREAAMESLGRALNGYHLEGVVTNYDFCNALIHHPAFRSGDLSTGFLKEHFQDGISDAPEPLVFLHSMAITGALIFHNRRALVRESLKPMSPLIGAGRVPPNRAEYVVHVDPHVFRLRMEGDPPGRMWKIALDDREYEVLTPPFEYYSRRLAMKINGVSHMFRLQYENHHIRCSYNGLVKAIEVYTPREWELAPHMLRTSKAVRDDVLKCPMPGLITAIQVEEGAEVCRGQELIQMESMKMETGIASPIDARVEEILVIPGQAVEAEQILMKFRK